VIRGGMILPLFNARIFVILFLSLGCTAVARAARYPGPATAPTTAPAAAPVVFRVERFRVPGGLPPLPDAPAAEVRARGTRVMSIEASAIARNPFHSAAAVGDHTIELSGKSFPGSDGYYRVEFRFEDRKSDGSFGMSSNIVLKPGTTLVVGGFGPGGDGMGEVLLFTLEPSPGDAASLRAPTTSAATPAASAAAP